MKALHIPADSDPVKPIALVEWDGSLQALQTLVGGDVETLPFTGDVAPFFDEDGKGKDLPLNSRATIVVKQALDQLGRTLMPGDVIVGDMYLTGQTPEGEPMDLPEWAVDVFTCAPKR